MIQGGLFHWHPPYKISEKVSDWCKEQRGSWVSNFQGWWSCQLLEIMSQSLLTRSPTLCDWGSRLAMPLVWEVRREDWKYYGGRLQLMDYKVRKVKFWLTLATCNCRVFMMDQQSSHNRWLHKGKVRSEREKNDAKLKCGWDSDCRAEST